MRVLRPFFCTGSARMMCQWQIPCCNVVHMFVVLRGLTCTRDSNKRMLAVVMAVLVHMCVHQMPGFTCNCCSRSSWRSTCGSSWYHKCMGIFFAHPLRTPTKWSLNVLMDLLHKFLWWSSWGMSLYNILDVDPSASFVDSMASFMSPLHWLLRIWYYSLMAHFFEYFCLCCNEWSFFLVLEVFQPEELLLTWCITIMDMFWLSLSSSYICMKMLCFFSNFPLSLSFWAGCIAWVDGTPWHCPRMCPNCVSSDLGKYVPTFVVSTSGHKL